MATLNDVVTRIAANLQTTYEEVYGRYEKAYSNNRYGSEAMDPRGYDMKKEAEGYDRAMRVVEKAINEIIRDEIKSAKLDFLQY